MYLSSIHLESLCRTPHTSAFTTALNRMAGTLGQRLQPHSKVLACTLHLLGV